MVFSVVQNKSVLKDTGRDSKAAVNQLVATCIHICRSVAHILCFESLGSVNKLCMRSITQFSVTSAHAHHITQNHKCKYLIHMHS